MGWWIGILIIVFGTMICFGLMDITRALRDLIQAIERFRR